MSKSKVEPCYVIMVALENGKFEHYTKEPKIFYATYEEAEEVKNQLIISTKFKVEQFKIQKVWKVKL